VTPAAAHRRQLIRLRCSEWSSRTVDHHAPPLDCGAIVSRHI
jgi:hypothetical protein